MSKMSVNKILSLVFTFVMISHNSFGEVIKREISGLSYVTHHQGVGLGWNYFALPNNLNGAYQAVEASKFGFGPVKAGYQYNLSPADIASAISAAKEASIAVAEAQKRVQVANEDLLAQQHLASQKESEAAAALQKAEAAAAIFRQQATAAANAIILAQKRLAQAKAEVAEKQKIAAIKENEAAAAIQQNAVAAAIQVQKSDYNTAKLSALQQSGTIAALKHAAVTKEATLGATSAALAAAKSYSDEQRHWQ